MKQTIKKGKKILLTGGHAGTTAIAVAEELIRRKDNGVFDKIVWVGPKSAFEGKKVRSIEAETFINLGVESYTITTGKLQTKFTRQTIPSFLKIPFGFLHAIYLLRKIKPDVILSFGGFSAFPIVVVGKIFGIPIVIHDQTAAGGRANRISSFFAKRIAISREESRKYFNSNKTVLTGCPIMTQIAEIEPPQKIGKPPVIFIMGGSRGSKYINNMVKKIMDRLLEDYIVIHQTGLLSYREMEEYKNNLSEILSQRYFIYSSIDPMKIDNIYRQTDIFVGRSGANTVSEIMAIKRPSIFIPLPYTYLDEQTKNAEILKKLGLARIIKQSDLTPLKLLEEIGKITQDWEKIIGNVSDHVSLDVDASNKLVNLVEEV